MKTIITPLVRSLYQFLFATLLFSASFSAHAFTNLEGKQDFISNHIGKDKWTIVEVWESGCQACRMHMPDMVKFDGKLKNARILGISLDTQNGIEDAEDFIAEYDIKFPTLITNYVEMNVWMQKSLGEPLMGTPTFILFDPKGALVAAQPGIVSTDSLEKFIKLNSGKEKPQTVTVNTKSDKAVKSGQVASKETTGLPVDESAD